MSAFVNLKFIRFERKLYFLVLDNIIRDNRNVAMSQFDEISFDIRYVDLDLLSLPPYQIFQIRDWVKCSNQYTQKRC